MTEPPAQSSPPVEDGAEPGGESACQLDRVCAQCGALPDGPASPVCERCGAVRDP